MLFTVVCLSQTFFSNAYKFTATTTNYGPQGGLSCGGVRADDLVEGTDYIVVASSQAMQQAFWATYGGCDWSCKDDDGKPIDKCEFSTCASNGGAGDGAPIGGCNCKQQGSCWCGKDEGAHEAILGTAQLGCFTCAKGRFTKQRPYTALSAKGGDIYASKELRIVIADVCPYGANPKWCPARPGEENVCGQKNHLDFDGPRLAQFASGVDNNYFEFQPEACSEELRQRVATSKACSANIPRVIGTSGLRADISEAINRTVLFP